MAAGDGVPTVRVSSRLQLTTTFFPCSDSYHGRRHRRGTSAGPPPAMTADVRVVIRRHFPGTFVADPGRGGGVTRNVVEKVAKDIALRRRPARALREAEKVERSLAEDVIPLVRHKFDNGAVVAAAGEICAYVSAACADARLAHGGVHVLVLVDTFACPGVVLRATLPPPPTTMMKSVIVTKTAAAPCITELDSGMAPAKDTTARSSPGGVIGDGRPKPVVEEEKRFKGWLPW